MTTAQLKAELFRQLNYIADSEECMKKAVKAIKRIVASEHKANDRATDMATAKVNRYTIEAMDEARNGHTTPVDVSSYDAFVNSILGIDETN